MKKTTIATVVALFITTAFATAQVAQKEKNHKIPEKVLSEFKKEFKEVKKVRWDKEDGVYEAGFVYNRKVLSVTYTPEGKKLETETSIGINQLPAEVHQYINANKLGRIKEASRILKFDGSIEYEAEVKGMDYIFDQHGKFIKSEKA